jgi:hypothetical protein
MIRDIFFLLFLLCWFLLFPAGIITLHIISSKKQGLSRKHIALTSILLTLGFVLFHFVGIRTFLSSLQKNGHKNKLYEETYSNITFEGTVVSVNEHKNPLGRPYYTICVDLAETNTNYFRRDEDVAEGLGLRIQNGTAAFFVPKLMNHDSIEQSVYVKVNEKHDGKGVFINMKGEKYCIPIDFIADCKLDDFYDCECNSLP